MATERVDIEAAIRRHRLTVADYHKMGETGLFAPDARVELIEGELIDMAPIGSPHAGVMKQVLALLHVQIGAEAIVAVQDPITLGERSEPQPDLVLLRPRDDFYRLAHPTAADVLLLIEVADSSLAYDRDVKIPLYARHGIPEVWLINLPAGRVEVYHTPEQGEYRHIDLYRNGSVRARGVAAELPVERLGLSDGPR